MHTGSITTLHVLIAFALSESAFPANSPAPIKYDKAGSFATTTQDFPDLKDKDRDNRQVALKCFFPKEGKAFPLVIMSHGAAGSRHSYDELANHVASHGYVVICPEHVFSNTDSIKQDMKTQGGTAKARFMEAVHRSTINPNALLERPKDVSFAINMALAWNDTHRVLAGKMNRHKIAVMGHSYGAYTTLVSCGAQPILDYMDPPIPPGKGLAGDFSDPRITCGIALSPHSPGSTFFGQDSYKTIHKPLMCLSGSKDHQQRHDGKALPARTRLKIFRLIPEGDKYYLWLKNADHYLFGDAFPSKAREDAQRIIRAMTVVFFDTYLKDRQEAKGCLNANYAKTLTGRVVNRIRWFEK